MGVVNSCCATERAANYPGPHSRRTDEFSSPKRGLPYKPPDESRRVPAKENKAAKPESVIPYKSQDKTRRVPAEVGAKPLEHFDTAKKLRVFYATYAPDRTNTANDVVATYEGDVAGLNSALLVKYGYDLSSLRQDEFRAFDNRLNSIAEEGAGGASGGKAHPGVMPRSDETSSDEVELEKSITSQRMRMSQKDFEANLLRSGAMGGPG